MSIFDPAADARQVIDSEVDHIGKDTPGVVAQTIAAILALLKQHAIVIRISLEDK